MNVGLLQLHNTADIANNKQRLAEGIIDPVISRMNMVIDMDEPDEETMVERVLAITGCSDKKSVRTMTQIVRSIAQYCQDNLITDGCCGARELIAWVQSFMVWGDIQEAAHYTILSSVTADSESRIEIEGSCLDTVLAS